MSTAHITKTLGTLGGAGAVTVVKMISTKLSLVYTNRSHVVNSFD